MSTKSLSHLVADWPSTPAQARKIQDQLRHQVLISPGPEHVEYVAGLDVSYPRNRQQPARAAGVIVRLPDLTLCEQTVVEQEVDFPYVPGFLSFREVPPLLSVLDQLSITPEIVLCDGQGTAHPKRFGLACHLGVLTGFPSIGVAKSRLTGTYAPVAEEKGSWQPLLAGNEQLGAVLRTRTGVNPVFVSVGHKMDLPSALELVLALCPKYRIPVPTRIADRLCSQRNASRT